MTQTQDARFYIDCEFDGHNGPLLSIALVEEHGRSVHIEANVAASDPWVLANVVPLMEQHDATDCTRVAPNEVGSMIRWFIGDCERPVIIADSPVDIGRFCQALSTGPDGGWASADYPGMRFEVHNVDCYPTDLPGAVQHNAWWDAMALRHKLARLGSTSPAGEVGEPKIIMRASQCGRHRKDECGSCRAAWESNDYRIQTLEQELERLAASDNEAMRLLREARDELENYVTSDPDLKDRIDAALAKGGAA